MTTLDLTDKTPRGPGDAAFTAALTMATERRDDLEEFLEATGGNRSALHQARGRCLGALEGRPQGRAELLRALELIDHALDLLDARKPASR